MKKKGQQHTFDAAWQPLPAWQCINGYSYEVGVRNALTSSPHRGDFFSCLSLGETDNSENLNLGLLAARFVTWL